MNNDNNSTGRTNKEYKMKDYTLMLLAWAVNTLLLPSLVLTPFTCLVIFLGVFERLDTANRAAVIAFPIILVITAILKRPLDPYMKECSRWVFGEKDR
jgi:Na+-translocating ferredoxin:NAD+ oxidoreductase RnfA subunit